ncbi:MAG: serine protease, partial [Clostridia bacterium]|nr:serine protease [Clostridia bacterium]
MQKSLPQVVIVITVLLVALSFNTVHADTNGNSKYSFRKDYDAIDLAAKSVFYVEMYDRNDQCFGSGSGFIAFDEHLFVTNEHVIDGASYIKVWDEDNKMYFIDQFISVDKAHDIAM